jgi:YidC/Oxa1 family membrane protein insertase
MSPEMKKRGSILEFLVIFAIVYLVTQFAFRTFFPQEPKGQGAGPLVVLEPQARVKGDLNPILTISNRSSGALVLPKRCPMPPVDVFSVRGEGSGQVLTPITTKKATVPCEPLTEIAPQSEVVVDLGPWKYSLFGELGTYEVRLPENSVIVHGGGKALREPVWASAQFVIYEPGPFTKLFRALITKPFLNILIFIASLLPDHNLGIAVIILTVIVKLLLYIPMQHSLESQRKMQKAQPHLDEIRRRHKDDPKRMQEETMRVWREHGVNPFQSCLPMLIQIPILIGLFYVIRDGSHLALSRHLIYGPYLDLSWTFDTAFLGFDLLKPSYYVFPPLLVILQYVQMKMSFAQSARKKQQEAPKEPKKEGGSQAMQQKMMLYGLPLMIGVFAFQFPAAVSLYWGVSTIFAIGQQVVVNRKV